MSRSKKKDPVIKATTLFVDARTGKTYQRGDVVEGWEEERAAHYAAIGLVVIQEDEPEKDDGQMTIDDVQNEKDKKEETVKKPGPSETKPKQGSSKTK